MVMSAVSGARQLSVILTLQDRMSRQMALARAQVDSFGRSAQRSGKQAQASFDGANRSTSNYLLALRRNFLAWLAVAGAGIGIWASFVRAAQEQRQSLTILDGALRAAGTTWAEQRDLIMATVNALERKTSFSDEQQIQALTRLLLGTREFNIALGLLEPTLGLAARTGLDVAAAADLIAGVLRGDDGAIKKAEELGLTFDDVNSAAGRLNAILAFTEGWAEKNKDAYKDFANAVQDLHAAIAEELLPTLLPLIGTLTLLVEKAEIAGLAFRVLFYNITLPFKLLTEAIKFVIDSVETLKETFTPLGEAFKKPFEGIVEWFRGRINGMIGVLNAAIESVNAFIPFGNPIPTVPPIGAPGAPPIGTPGAPPPGAPGEPWFPGMPPGAVNPGGGSPIVNNISIASYGDLDFERRVQGKLDDLYRAGWRPS